MTNIRSELTEVQEIDGVAIVRFHDLNAVGTSYEAGGVFALESELSSVAEQVPMAVILDFEDKQFLPAAVIESVFIKFHQRLNGRLKMCNIPKLVREQFERNRLTELFDIYDRFEGALASVGDHHRVEQEEA